ncbi:MAG: ABC transporter permease [bacterium]
MNHSMESSSGTVARDLMRSVAIEIGVPLVAIVLSFALTGVFILAAHGNPIMVYGSMFRLSFQDGYGFAQVLQKTSQLIFTGLSVAFAFRAGLFNIGAEGQLYTGAFVIGLVGMYLGEAPSVVTVPLLIVMGILGGALWAALPGILKAWVGAHEVITTIMLNFVAAALMSYLVSIPQLHAPGSVHTYPIPESAQLAPLSTWVGAFRGSTASTSLFLALGAAAFMGWFLWRTRWGYELRAVGQNPMAARTAGISVGRVTIVAMLISGGLAGLVGTDAVMGYKHYFEKDFSSGIGYLGIAVALLGRNHPVGVVLAAFLFGVLNNGKVALTGQVSNQIIEILQGILILMVVVNTKLFHRYLGRWKRRRVPIKS